jgi:hypothetical protein
MPNDIQEQIATYFQWVETRTGFPLHADTAPDVMPDITLNGRSTIDDASVIELDVPNHRRPRTLRLVAIAGLAAAVIAGVILIADRPAAEPFKPVNSGPPIDTVLQDEVSRRAAEAAARLAEQRRLLEIEAARRAEAAATTIATTATMPGEATVLTVTSQVSTLQGSWIVDIHLTDASSGWVVTSDVLAHTTDDGVTWTTRPLPSLENTVGAGKSFMLDSDHAWVVRVAADGSVVVTKTEDGNATTGATTIDTGFADGIPSTIVFVDQDNGYVSIVDPATQSATLTGRAHLFRTVDGGESFQLVNPDSPVPLAFSDSQHGWGTGEGLFVTADGAATWTQVKPPLWDSKGPDPTGPAYQIVSTSPTLTVVKVTAPTGTMAQVRYAATTDHGTTWADVAPPDTGEVSNTGPQSSLTVVADTHWFGIQPTENQDATLWTRTTDEGSYHTTHLPFPALTITMATPSVGWSAASTGIFSTVDGGATWTKVANLISA